jgi:hypothetical protein
MKAPIAQFFALPGNAPESALSSAFVVKSLFKITRIAAGISVNGVEYCAFAY